MREITKARTTSCFFLPLAIHPENAANPLSVATALEAYSSIMDAPHEFFDSSVKTDGEERSHDFFASRTANSIARFRLTVDATPVPAISNAVP